MIGLERDPREEQLIAAPAAANPVAATPATAVEVAGLRERMDGVTMKLDEVGRRVGALEATQRGDVGASQNDRSDKSAPSGEHSLVGATKFSGDTVGADASERSPVTTDASIGARPAIIGAATDSRLHVPTPATTSVVVMLSDVQFARLLGGAAWPPTSPESDGDDRHPDWRLRRNSRRTSRSRHR
jgi:hypothetical protein